MRYFDNPNDLPVTIVINRLQTLDPLITVTAFHGPRIGPDFVQIGSMAYIQVESTNLTDDQIISTLLLSQTQDETALLAQKSSAAQSLNTQFVSDYSKLVNMQSMNVSSPQAQIVNAIKDLASMIQKLYDLSDKPHPSNGQGGGNKPDRI